MDDASVSPPTPPNPSAATPPDPNESHQSHAASSHFWIVLSVVGIVVLIVLGPNLGGWGILPPFASDRSNDIYWVMFLFTAAGHTGLLHGRGLWRL